MGHEDANPENAKRIRRLYDKVSNSRKNCAFEDLERLLIAVGFESRKSSGSHVFFKLGTRAISVPKRKPVKETYVEQTLGMIDEIINGSRAAKHEKE